MVALSEDEQLITRLFRHRFRGGEGLEGHSFGNLFVAALAEITGDFAQAIKLSSQVLATRGHIYPATVANVALRAQMDDGSFVNGETNITASKRRIAQLFLEPAEAEPLPKRLKPWNAPTSSPLAPVLSTPVSSPTCWLKAFRKR